MRKRNIILIALDLLMILLCIYIIADQGRNSYAGAIAMPFFLVSIMCAIASEIAYRKGY